MPSDQVLLGNPVLRLGIARRQYHFAGLQADALAALDALQDFFGGLAALGHDVGQLLDEGFGHGVRNRAPCVWPRRLNDLFN